MAKKRGKKVILLPHSTNKMNKFQLWLSSRYIKQFDLIFTREDASYNILSKYHSDKIISSIDVGFFNYITKLNEKTDNKEIKQVAITLRNSNIGDIGTISNAKKDMLEKYLFDAFSYLNSNDTNFYIIVQTKKDLEYSKVLFDKLNKKYSLELVEEYDTFDLLKTYEVMDLVIGMRLHSLILSMSVGVPVVGLFTEMWGAKNAGTLEKLKLKYVQIESFQGEIQDAINYNLDHLNETKHIIFNNHSYILQNLSSFVNSDKD